MDNKRDWLIKFDYGEAPASTLDCISGTCNKCWDKMWGEGEYRVD